MSKIEIPAEVVDKKAYIKFIALSRNPLIRNPFVETSEGETINLHTAPQWIRKYVQHLPPKEQEEITAKKAEWQRLNMKMRIAESTAYGKRNNVGGRPKQDVVEHDIVELLGRMFTIPEDNKRPRLEELAWMYSRMKMRYVAYSGIDAYNAMLRTLEQLRKEAEGDQININGALDVNVNVEIQAQIQKQILKTINLKEIILGRIAARMGFDTKKLIAGLHNSYYAKFVNISGDFDPNEEMQYPSLINYDYNEIEFRNQQVDDVVDIKAEEVPDTEKQKADAVREMFLAKIRAQREQAEARTSAYTNLHGSDYKEASETDLGEKRKIGGRRKK